MKTNWQPSKQVIYLAYIQKIIAAIIAIYLGFVFLQPTLLKVIPLPQIIISIFVLTSLIVFELMFHFGLKASIEDLAKQELHVLHILTAILSFLVLFFVDLYSTENLAFFKNDQKPITANVDSLLSLKNDKIKEIETDYLEQGRSLDNFHLANLKKVSAFPYLFAKADKDYRDAKANLIKEKEKIIEKTRRAHDKNISRVKTENLTALKAYEDDKKRHAANTSYIGLFVLLFSAFSTALLCSINPEIEHVQPVVQEVVQEQSKNVQPQIQQVVQVNVNSILDKKKYSESRQKATIIYTEKYFDWKAKELSFDKKLALINKELEDNETAILTRSTWQNTEKEVREIIESRLAN